MASLNNANNIPSHGFSRQLEKVRNSIVKELDVNKLFPKLLRKGVFTVSEERKILAISTPDERTNLILDVVASKEKTVFIDFCQTLGECSPKLLTLLAVEGFEEGMNSQHL